MKVHFLRCISPILGDRVILLYSASKKLNDAIDDELVFAKAVNDTDNENVVLCWMVDEAHEQAAIDLVEKLGGDNCWCDTCMAYDEACKPEEEPCEIFVEETESLGFEPCSSEKEAHVAEGGGFKIPEALKQFLKKEVGGPLAEFAKTRAKQIAKDQAKAVGVTLEDSFFEDVFNAFKGAAVETSKTMSVTEAAKVLSVEWPCSKEQVVTAFRVMAKVKHPDRPGGSADAFMRIVEARAVLTKALE